MMPQFFLDAAAAAEWNPSRYAKRDLLRGAGLFLGLNCFERGQTQAQHQHSGADKFYLVLSGNARMTVGGETRDAGPGTLVWAPRGVPHGVDLVLERTIMLVGMGPPPP